jgi:hypothetical protein
MLNLGDRRKKMKLADYLLNGANTTQDFTKPNAMFHCFANIIACVNSFALGTFIRTFGLCQTSPNCMMLSI